MLSPSLTSIRTHSLHLTVTTSAIPGITGCYRSSTHIHFSCLSFNWVCHRELEASITLDAMTNAPQGLVFWTLIRVVQTWRRTSNNNTHAVLVKHNIFYYACGLYESAPIQHYCHPSIRSYVPIGLCSGWNMEWGRILPIFYVSTAASYRDLKTDVRLSLLFWVIDAQLVFLIPSFSCSVHTQYLLSISNCRLANHQNMLTTGTLEYHSLFESVVLIGQQ